MQKVSVLKFIITSRKMNGEMKLELLWASWLYSPTTTSPRV